VTSLSPQRVSLAVIQAGQFTQMLHIRNDSHKKNDSDGKSKHWVDECLGPLPRKRIASMTIRSKTTHTKGTPNPTWF